MIKTPTLFILGAGASVPFGYPTGGELRDNICDKKYFNRLIKLVDQIPPSHPLGLTSEVRVKEFIKDFKDSMSYSIDAFLERRKEHMKIGKQAISMILKKYEIESQLKLSMQANNWLMYLFNRINQCSFDNFNENKISFVIFNYDISLEQFIFKALQKFYGKEPGSAIQVLQNIPIVHLYGKINNNPFIDSNNDSDLLKAISIAENNLKLIKAERTNSGGKEAVTGEFKKAHSMIEKAQNIYFLGFGFDETNLERLNIRLMKNKTIRFTSMGLEDSRLSWIKKQFNTAKADQHLFPDCMDCLNILKKNLNFE
jgi:hypothetical protein